MGVRDLAASRGLELLGDALYAPRGVVPKAASEVWLLVHPHYAGDRANPRFAQERDALLATHAGPVVIGHCEREAEGIPELIPRFAHGPRFVYFTEFYDELYLWSSTAYPLQPDRYRSFRDFGDEVVGTFGAERIVVCGAEVNDGARGYTGCAGATYEFLHEAGFPVRLSPQHSWRRPGNAIRAEE